MRFKTQNTHTDHGPKEITSDNVQYWCRHTGQLMNSQVNKAKRFIQHDCVQYIGGDAQTGSHTFVCLPLNQESQWMVNDAVLFKKPYAKNYNSSEYKMWKLPDGRFKCQCQGWDAAERNEQKRRDDGVQCAHTLALIYCFKMKVFNRGQGSTEKLEEIEQCHQR